jgi:hypothetical protein
MPKPVEGPNVQTALAFHVRPRHAVRYRPQIEPSGRDRARHDFDRVMPEWVLANPLLMVLAVTR